MVNKSTEIVFTHITHHLLEFLFKYSHSHPLPKHCFPTEVILRYQSSVKSIRKCKKSLYNQPKPYFFKKLL